MEQMYYFITVFEKLDIDKLGWPETGHRRTWGFYKDKERAFRALHENWTDMNETIYNFALIEEYEEGIGHYTGNRQFFKYDRGKDGYFELDEPKEYKHFCSFALS